jgi:chemotaxis protein MotB
MSAFVEQETPKSEGAPEWVVTFGDMMSLLLCFFILLLSFSELDRQKYKQVAGSLKQAFGVQRKLKVMEMPKGMKIIAQDFDQETIPTRIKEDLGREINEMLDSELHDLKDQVSLAEGDEGIVIRLMGESTFDSGKAEIRDQVAPLLQKVATVLEAAPGDVIIAGHTDNVPIRTGPFGSNLRLSIARAAAVAEFILQHSRTDPKRVSTMGFGEYRPIENNTTEAGRQKNRRVEIILGKIPVSGHSK